MVNKIFFQTLCMIAIVLFVDADMTTYQNEIPCCKRNVSIAICVRYL